MSTDLERVAELLDVRTGELLPATIDNAALVLDQAREAKRRIDGAIRAATEFLVDESRRHGTKTFHTPNGDVSLTGGATTTYSATDLEECLREAGCPEERIREVVKTKVEYTVDQRVLRQLVAANPDYRAAAELAATVEERPYRASVKGL